MRKLAFALVTALTLAGCGTNPFSAIANPISATRLYQAELVFAASLETFNKYKDLCVRRVIASKCRTYVLAGQRGIRAAVAADATARDFVDRYPTLDATNVVQAFTGLVGNFSNIIERFRAL